MADKRMTAIIRRRIIKGLIQSGILFGIFFGFSFLQSTPAGQMAFSRAAVFSIMLVFGYSLNRLYTDLRKQRLGHDYYNAGTAFGMVIAGTGFWQSMASFDEFRLWPGRFALILLSGIIGYAISILADYRSQEGKGLWWGFLGWLKDKPPLKLLFGILIGIYLVYVRPYLSIDPNTLTILEWALFCALALVILFRVWSGAERDISSAEPDRDWGKHDPAIEKLTGAGHDTMIRAERQFLSIGEPYALYVLLVILLSDNGIPEHDIVNVVEPLTNFKGVNQARQSNRILSRKVAKQQRKMRSDAVSKTFSGIAELGNLNRIAPGSRRKIQTAVEKARPVEETSITDLTQNFLEKGDCAGLFTRIILLLHNRGRYHERIVSDLRKLTDDAGNPIKFETESLLTSLKVEDGIL